MYAKIKYKLRRWRRKRSGLSGTKALAGALPLEMLVERQDQGKPFIATHAELRRERVLDMINAVKEKWDTILILIVLLGGLVAVINPRFDSLETSLNSKVDEVKTELIAKVEAVETKFNYKFNNLAEMMIVAHINGEATREELLAIWERVVEED